MLFCDVTYVGISLVHISIVLHTLFGLVVGGRVFTFALALFLFPTHPPLTTTTQATNFSLATPFALWAKGTSDIPHLLQEKTACRCSLCFVVFCNVLDAVDVSNSRVRVHTRIYIYTGDIRSYVYIPCDTAFNYSLRIMGQHESVLCTHFVGFGSFGGCALRKSYIR